MDIYHWLRLMHVAGFILLGGGLLAVFVSEWRAYGAASAPAFAEVARYTAIFYRALVTPGALLIGASGFLLVRQLGIGWFDVPWLVGMWGLFLFEFIEGNTVTRFQFLRTLRLSLPFADGEPLTEERRRAARTLIGQAAHFLDIPLFSVMVYCGMLRPERWSEVATAIGLAVCAAALLTVFVPRLAKGGPANLNGPASDFLR